MGNDVSIEETSLYTPLIPSMDHEKTLSAAEIPVNKSMLNSCRMEVTFTALDETTVENDIATDEKACSNLYDAVKRKDWDRTRLTLDEGTVRQFVNYFDKRRLNVLHWACHHDDTPPELLKSIVREAKSDLFTTRTLNGWTPLQWAIMYSSSHDKIMMVLDACPEAAVITNDLGQTPLHLVLVSSCTDKWTEIPMKRAILYNASRDATDKLLIIHQSSIPNDKLSTVIRHILMACPSCVYVKDNNGDTPLALFMKSWERGLQETLQSFENREKDDILLSSKESILDQDVISNDGKIKKISWIYEVAVLLLCAHLHHSLEDIPVNTFMNWLLDPALEQFYPRPFRTLVFLLQLELVERRHGQEEKYENLSEGYQDSNLRN